MAYLPNPAIEMEADVFRMQTASIIGVALMAVAVSAPAASAADHQVQMANKGADGKPMQFDPAFLKVEPGDTVTFVPKDKGHDSMSVEGMIPAGAEPWKGKMNEQVTVTFDKPGLYGYKCEPHFGLGMVGLIEVGGDVSNLDALKAVKLPGAAKKRMAALLEEAEAK